jgi:AraC-like DNA-binding protein
MGGGSQNNHTWISKAVSLIEEDIRKHFTIKELAVAVGTNSYSLKQGFRQIFGIGPYEYLQNERLKKAVELLLQTTQPVKNIAWQVGYKSPSSFIVVFKKKYQTSPSQWRKAEKRKLRKG